MSDLRRSLIAVLLTVAVGLPGSLFAQQAQPRLHIVVVDGEDSVNIIQQGTAVAPVVEVRDENDQPVAGAVVLFAIRRGRNARFAGNLQRVSVTTNASGRATVAGLTPTGNGPVQIDISASYRGANASTTVTQTNVATASQAAAAGGGAAAGGAAAGTAGAAVAAGAAGAGGAGLSGIAIGAIAAGAAGAVGTAVALRSSSDSPTSPTTAAPVVSNLSGPFVTSYTWSFSASPTNNGGPCTVTRALVGTSSIQLTTTGTTVSGTLETTYSETNASQTCAANYFIGEGPITWRTPVSGSTTQITANGTGGGFTIPVTGGQVTGVGTFSFTGSVSGGVMTGTISLTRNGQGQGAVGPIAVTASTTTNVTLR